MNIATPGREHPQETPVFSVPSIAILAAAAVSAAVFLVRLFRLNLLPLSYAAGITGGLACLLVLLFFLVRHFRWQSIRCLLGLTLAILMSGGLIYGCTLLASASKTLNKITEISDTQVNEVTLYVRTDDPAQSPEEISDYTIGILETQNRSITDEALTQLTDALGHDVPIRTYRDPITLIQGLLDQETDGILLVTAYYDMLRDEADYTSLLSGIRALTALQVSTSAETASAASQSAASASSGSNRTAGSSGTDAGSNASADAADSGSEGSASEAKDDNILVLYLSGVDDCSDLNGIANGDVNILAVINLETHQIALIATPRDAYVLLPSFGEYDKLTLAAF